MIARRGQALTAKRYAASLLSRDLCNAVDEWPEAASGPRAAEQDAMTDRELAEVGRHLRELRDRCIYLLGEGPEREPLGIGDEPGAPLETDDV